MSITKEKAGEIGASPAVVCCRTLAGSVISPAELEDPSIFPDLEESGLLSIKAGTLSVAEVLGAKLLKDIDGLTCLTADLLDGVKKAPARPPVNPPAEKSTPPGVSDGFFRFRADSITGLDISFPLYPPAGFTPASPASQGNTEEITDELRAVLVKRHYAVEKITLGEKTAYADGVLTLRQSLVEDAEKASPLVKKVALDLILPENRHIYSQTIMDVIPVATKVEGQLGSGITNTLDGMVFILTGVDEDGLQVHEFGSCEGYLDEKIVYGRPGCPDPQDIMVRVHVVLERSTGMERRGPFAAHSACDKIIQEVRDILKVLPASNAIREEELREVRRHGRTRVVLVKEIMGQGAMHDNVMLPSEPAGVPGGRNNVDLGNVPVVLSPNEVRDGGIHALCCIGPASKEVTRHYFREPILESLAEDTELDLAGVVFIGSPQVNDEKAFVARRLGALVETMGVAGAIITTEGFGNNHIDFAANLEEVGKRGIKVVGVTFAAYQGQLVVGNTYMDALIELNKDKEGCESEILGENSITPQDAKRAILMLKNKISGVPILPADRRWNQQVVASNQAIADAR
ncbi:MAG: D-proline reductase (dithiol) proprotein PrdA [Planctomycetota bacterium]|jgi:D-proline reductase (dithiol) PrdA|nr:D-proline reductase (dithiol) proprotein PrdA [Planctomycetota bacterium]